MNKETKQNFRPIVTIRRESDNQTLTVDLDNEHAMDMIKKFANGGDIYLNNFKNKLNNNE